MNYHPNFSKAKLYIFAICYMKFRNSLREKVNKFNLNMEAAKMKIMENKAYLS